MSEKATAAEIAASKARPVLASFTPVVLDLWHECRAVNSRDPYSARCVSYAEDWARLMDAEIAKGRTVQDCATETSHAAATDGITGFMYGAAVSMLAKFWKHGETLRTWHNGEYGHPEAKGTINPAIITQGAHLRHGAADGGPRGGERAGLPRPRERDAGAGVAVRGEGGARAGDRGAVVSAHTPGPWTTHREHVVGPRRSPSFHDSRQPIPVCQMKRTCTPAPMVDANAHLIAAAPDLLEALRRTTELLEWHRERAATSLGAREELDEAVSDASAAIAKAEGAAT